MPTAYKGKLRIACRLDRCSKHDIMTNVRPECIVCENGNAEVIDLDEKAVLSIRFEATPIVEEKEPEPAAEPEPVTEKRKKKR